MQCYCPREIPAFTRCQVCGFYAEPVYVDPRLPQPTPVAEPAPEPAPEAKPEETDQKSE